jgi:hypothetical protein
MTDTKFKEVIYGPYLDVWKIIKILQHASDDNPELFLEYMNKVEKFENAYQGNEFADFLRKAVLLRADDVIAKINREDVNAM